MAGALSRIARRLVHPYIELPLRGRQRQALLDYTEDSLPINYALQQGVEVPQAKHLDAIIKKYGLQFEDPVMVYRGINSPDLGKSYLSVAADKDVAERFVVGPHGEVKKIVVPPRTPILPISDEFVNPEFLGRVDEGTGDEYVVEWLLPRGFKYASGGLARVVSYLLPEAGRVYDEAVEFGRQFPRSSEEGPGDAARHAYAASRMARLYGPGATRMLGGLYEALTLGGDRRARRMDEYNNEAGIGLAELEDAAARARIREMIERNQLETLPVGAGGGY